LTNGSELDKLPRYASVLLEDDFRKRFIQDAIEKAGSLCELGRILGYTGKASNWNVKQILYGKQGIPLFRLKRLCQFMNLSIDQLQNKIKKIKTSK